MIRRFLNSKLLRYRTQNVLFLLAAHVVLFVPYSTSFGQAVLVGEPNLTPLADLPTPHIDELLAKHGKNAELPVPEILSGEDDQFRREFSQALLNDAREDSLNR